MGSEEDQNQDRQEENIFEKLLSYKDKVHRVTVRAPFLEEPIIIHYMALKEGEFEPPDFPEGFTEYTPGDKIRTLLEYQEMRVWTMIEKANKNKDTPEKYKMTREQFFGLKENFFDVYQQIVAMVSGTAQETLRTFIDGQPSQD
jgi:hypothetical protein